MFSHGQVITLREIWQDRVWSARPVIVVQDSPEMIALYSPANTIFKMPTTDQGERPSPQTRFNAKWTLQDGIWPDYGNALRLAVPGANYSVIRFFARGSWYINFEAPLRRTDIGFDYMDQLLDIIVKPDRQNWFWKDEDEVVEAVRLGLMTEEYAQEMHADGKKIADSICRGDAPFSAWDDWTPDPSWTIPELTDGWDRI